MTQANPNRRLIIGIIVTGVAIVLSASVFFITKSNLEGDLAVVQNEIVAQKNKDDTRRAAEDAANAKVSEEVLGISSERKASDDTKATKMFETALTWANGDAYAKARETMAKTYKLADDSQFMTEFMPKPVEVPIGDKPDENGHAVRKYEIDVRGLNMGYLSAKTYVTRISNGTYSYIADVNISANDGHGNTAASKCVWTYDIDSEGNISNIVARTATPSTSR